MCGGFAGLYTGNGASRTNHIQYHFGRLLTYLTMGLIAGWLGRSIDQASSLIGLQKAASVLVGIALIAAGIKGLYPTARKPIPGLIFKYLTGPMHNLLKNNRDKKSRFFPLFLGIVTTLLPCGWLYAYVVVAAGTAEPMTAVLVMFFFWLGTIPMLAFIGTGAHRLLPSANRIFPRLTPILLVIAGTYSLFAHMAPPAQSHCHHHMEMSAEN